MDKFEAAAQMNGNSYGEEGTKEFFKELKENNLVAVFGYSDDAMELRGAIHDETYGNSDGYVYLNQNGLWNAPDDCDCDCHKPNTKDYNRIKMLWCEEANVCWTYKTDIPHATFNILEEQLEEDDIYCRGIIFSLDDLK